MTYIGIQDKDITDEKQYYENGQLKEIGKYERQEGSEWKEREGEWKKYHRNGQLQEIGNYHLNKKTGEWKYFDEKGKLTKTENFD